MKESVSKAVKICPECGADSAAIAQKCWVCHADLRATEAVIEAEVISQQTVKQLNKLSELFFAISTLVLVGSALLVGIGLFLEEPGLGVAYAIVTVPALLATVIRVGLRASRGQVTWAERFTTLIVSAAVTAGVLVLLVLAAIAALFLYCIAALQQLN